MTQDDRFTARHRTLDTLQEGIVITGPCGCMLQQCGALAHCGDYVCVGLWTSLSTALGMCLEQC